VTGHTARDTGGWTTVAEVLEQRAARDGAIRAALEAFPDLILDGEHVASPSLRTEDCDTVVCLAHGRLTTGKRVGALVVLRWGLQRQHLEDWLEGVREKQPELYRQLVRSVGGG
jgi:hypothetical protein